jgi:hypothetical protein
MWFDLMLPDPSTMRVGTEVYVDLNAGSELASTRLFVRPNNSTRPLRAMRASLRSGTPKARLSQPSVRRRHLSAPLANSSCAVPMSHRLIPRLACRPSRPFVPLTTGSMPAPRAVVVTIPADTLTPRLRAIQIRAGATEAHALTVYDGSISVRDSI